MKSYLHLLQLGWEYCGNLSRSKTFNIYIVFKDTTFSFTEERRSVGGRTEYNIIFLERENHIVRSMLEYEKDLVPIVRLIR